MLIYRCRDSLGMRLKSDKPAIELTTRLHVFYTVSKHATRLLYIFFILNFMFKIKTTFLIHTTNYALWLIDHLKLYIGFRRSFLRSHHKWTSRTIFISCWWHFRTIVNRFKRWCIWWMLWIHPTGAYESHEFIQLRFDFFWRMKLVFLELRRK